MIGRLVLAGVVLASVSFAGGFLARPLVTPTEAYREDLAVGAYVAVRAYHADGSLYAMWEGHNALTGEGKMAIVGCLSGLDTTPNTASNVANSSTGCTSLTHLLRIADSVSGFSATKLATKSVPVLSSFTGPISCQTDRSAAGVPFPCTSWKLEATFDSEITQAANIDGVAAVTEFGAGSGTFLGVPISVAAPEFNRIAITPAIAVAAGDRLIITLNFNVP